MNPLAHERRSRDTRPQPAWRHPATPCKAAQPPPPPAMKRLALLLPLLALAAAPARAEDPATRNPALSEPHAKAATNGIPHEAIERMRSAMTWDAITNAMESLGDELETLDDGWLFGGAFYKIQNGALPFEPSKAEFEPEWPEKVDFADIFLPGVARSAELERRAEAVFDPAFAAAFDRFRRELVAAVDAGSEERFEALVDPAWRESLRGKGGAPAAFGARFFVAALADRESQYDVPRVLLRPLLPDEATRLLALAPGESNRVDRTFACLAWMWDNGPRVDFAVVRDGDSFAMAAPPLWRFVPAAIGKVCREDDVTGCPSFETPWRSDASDRFGAVLLGALRSGDSTALLDRLCPEADTPAARARLRHNVTLDAKAFAGLSFRIRSRFSNVDREMADIGHWLDSSFDPRKCDWTKGPSPASLHPGLWLAFDAVVETNGVECPLATYYGVLEKDGNLRLLVPGFPFSGETPTPEEIRRERRQTDRCLKLVSGDGRFRFLGFLASSLAAPDGTKPALVPNFTLILSADPVDPPDPATNDPATNATSLHAETADGAEDPAP